MSMSHLYFLELMNEGIICKRLTYPAIFVMKVGLILVFINIQHLVILANHFLFCQRVSYDSILFFKGMCDITKGVQ